MVPLLVLCPAIHLRAGAYKPISVKSRQAGARGDAEAQADLGGRYAMGIGVKKDYAEAVRMYRMAAAQGNARGQCGLGVCYARGDGVKKDDVEAVKWFRQAADQGNEEGQFNLGHFSSNGEGLAKDDVEVYNWMLLAGGQGDVSAKQYLTQLEDSCRGSNWRRDRNAPAISNRQRIRQFKSGNAWLTNCSKIYIPNRNECAARLPAGNCPENPRISWAHQARRNQ